MTTLPDCLQTSLCTLRPWAANESADLVRHANNTKIARNLWDRFPDPYRRSDAAQVLAQHAGKPPLGGAYAIVVEQRPVGTISVHPRVDVERLTGEIGYWLGEEYWGRGIATAAAAAVTDAVFAHSELVRLYAPVFSWNPASMRVLEKVGYQREGILRRSVVKDGVVLDRVLFSRTRAAQLPYEPYVENAEP